jgi:hypothetical protein
VSACRSWGRLDGRHRDLCSGVGPCPCRRPRPCRLLKIRQELMEWKAVNKVWGMVHTNTIKDGQGGATLQARKNPMCPTPPTQWTTLVFHRFSPRCDDWDHQSWGTADTNTMRIAANLSPAPRRVESSRGRFLAHLDSDKWNAVKSVKQGYVGQRQVMGSAGTEEIRVWHPA